MRKLFVATLAGACMTLSYAHAADQERWPRWYAGLSGGVTFLNDTDISGDGTGSVNYNTGGIVTASLGYMPPATMQPFSNMRFEAELGYHYNSASSVSTGGAVFDVDDQAKTLSYMGNVYYDFRSPSRWTPYLGAGAGGARVTLSGENANAFAYQFMGGISYAPASLPMTEWNMGYRYFVVQNPEFNSSLGKFKLDDYRTHNIEFGGKFRF